MMKRLLRDPAFWASIVAAALCWLAFGVYTSVQIDLAWPLREPEIFLLPVFVYPILEEIVFRGWLQGALLASPYGRITRGGISLANLSTSVVFVLAHLAYHFVPWSLAIFVPSLLFGFFRERYGSLAPPILLHVVFNFGYSLFFRGH